MGDLRRRRKLTLVGNVCKAAPRSLFWAPNGFNKLPEVRYEFRFILIGKSTMAFLQANDGTFSNPGIPGGGGKNKDFKAVSQTDLTRVEFRLWRKLASG